MLGLGHLSRLRVALQPLNAATSRSFRHSIYSRGSATGLATEAPLVGVSAHTEAEYPTTFTQSHLIDTEQLAKRRADLEVVGQLESSTGCERMPFYWPFGRRKADHAAEYLLYGALASAKEFPLTPLVYKWGRNTVPQHVDTGVYKDSLSTATSSLEQLAKLGCPGVTTVTYLGDNLGLTRKGSGSNAGGDRDTVHPGIMAILLDDITARASTANAQGSMNLTANLQVEHPRQIRTGRFSTALLHLENIMSSAQTLGLDEFETSSYVDGGSSAAAAAPITPQAKGAVNDDSSSRNTFGTAFQYELGENTQVSGGLAPLNTTRTACDALGISTSTPFGLAQSQGIAGTPDSAVLNRMMELESVIATVKTSLESHASSYFSVASQIAELNARIGKLSVSQSAPNSANAARQRTPSSKNSAGQMGDVASLRIDASQNTPTKAQLYQNMQPGDGSEAGDGDGDEQYDRIQEMIDSLIKDANSALASKPSAYGQTAPAAAATVYSGDSADMLSSCPVFIPDDASSSATTKASDDTLYTASPSDTKRPTSKPMRRTLDYSSDLFAGRPASAQGVRTKGRRHLMPRALHQHHSRHSHIRHNPAGSYESSSDPTEADGESDTDIGTMSTASSYYSKNPRQYKSTGRYYEHRYGSNRLPRYRSDTTDSLISNSSETCVPPSARISREFNRPSMASICSRASTPVDVLCTPTRASFGMDDDDADGSVFIDEQQYRHQYGQQQQQQQSPDILNGTHEFPRLVQDEYQNDCKARRMHRRSFSRDDGVCARDIPLIRRFRNSVTRVALKSASFVDKSVNLDIAAFETSQGSAGNAYNSSNHPHRQPRMRSSTTVSELSTVFTPPRYQLTHAGDDYSAQAPTYPASFHEDPAASSPLLWTRRHRSTLSVSPRIGASSFEAPGRVPPPAVPGGSGRGSIDYSPKADAKAQWAGHPAGSPLVYSVRKPDSIEEYDSNCESTALEKASSELAATNSGASGLVGMISLLYWTLLFTLGALMLDSFLCQVAGKRVMGTVDKIAQIEADSEDGSSQKRRLDPSSNDKDSKPAPMRQHVGCDDSPNVASTVGRFVRWYVEGPDALSPQQSLVHDAASRSDLGLGAGNGQPSRFARARKASAKRGSFKHVG
ncbi:hypothetical protein GGI12_000269 [Dipsacomyces acuminosporus]|nr:hypothetical protein GGI12_000269 [Dipsacomyces acuminosporus]